MIENELNKRKTEQNSNKYIVFTRWGKRKR